MANDGSVLNRARYLDGPRGLDQLGVELRSWLYWRKHIDRCRTADGGARRQIGRGPRRDNGVVARRSRRGINPSTGDCSPWAGLTDQVSEPAAGRLGVNKAVKVVVDPAATVTKEGPTEILYEGGFGLGNPPPQPARPSVIKGNVRAICLKHFTTSLSSLAEQALAPLS